VSSAAVSLPKTIWRPGPAWTTSSWPAADVEALVTDALCNVSSNAAASQIDIRSLIDRVVIGRATIRIQLSEVAEGTYSVSGPKAVIIAGGGFEANFGPGVPTGTRTGPVVGV
jgi:hypothetical protein